MTEPTALRASTDPLDLAACRRDLWPRTTLATVQGADLPEPAVVTWPTSAVQVRAALDMAAEQDRVVVPYGAGSGVCGGASGHGGALVIDLKAMDRILELDPDARTVRVEPGVLGQHLEDWLARRGWMTAHSPSSIWCSTVGGYVAARSAGQFSSRYGVFDDMLLAARAEAPAGTIEAGAWTPPGQEDLLPVLSGSEGGLGVVTEALVRIAPLPEKRWLRGYAFPNLQSAWTAMRLLLQAGLWPAALRLYDPMDTRINRTTRGGRRPAHDGPGVLKRLREAASQVPGLQRHLADLPLALPRLVNTVAGALGQEVALIVGFEGPARIVDAQVAVASGILAAGRDLGPGPGERWFAHRHAVSYKQAPFFAAGAFADTMEVAAPWSRLEALHDGVREAIGRHGLVMAHFSHAYPEGCSIYFSFAAQGRLDVYDALWADALDAAWRAGGTVTHHHGVGQLKAAAAAREAGAALRVWRALKASWDPDGRMNPGRPFPEDAPETTADLPAPTGGPVYAVSETDLLATVDPEAEPAALDQALAARGLELRIRPDRPLARWLTALDRRALDAWECPLFAVQARFEDGTAARLAPAPRSAAGPDLRLALLRRARAEWVQVPVRRHGGGAADLVLRPAALQPDARDVRPTWRKEDRWGFDAALAPVAEALQGERARGRSPRRSPTQDRAEAAPNPPPPAFPPRPPAEQEAP